MTKKRTVDFSGWWAYKINLMVIITINTLQNTNLTHPGLLNFKFGTAGIEKGTFSKKSAMASKIILSQIDLTRKLVKRQKSKIFKYSLALKNKHVCGIINSS